MKTVAVVGLIAVFATISPVFAAEYQKNPDHLPSISFTLGYGKSTGNQDFIAFGSTVDKTDLSSDFTEIATVFKLPTSDSVTILGSLAFGKTNFDSDETPLFVGSDGDSSGWAFHVGFVKYFGR